MRLAIILLFFLPVISEAAWLASPVEVDDYIVLPDITEPQVWYGTLDDWPHTFSFTVSTTTVFMSQVYAKTDSEQQLSQILVREEKRGVSESARSSAKKVEWNISHIPSIGLKLQSSPVMEATLSPGSYRFEISHPNNQATYRLVLGDRADNGGYFSLVKEAWIAHGVFAPRIGFLASTVVYIPLFLMLSAIIYWRFRRRRHD